MKATIDDAGRIQLPDELQADLGLQPGDDVVFEHASDSWRIKRGSEATGLQREGALLVHKGQMTTGTVEDAIRSVRDERYGQLTEGLQE